MPEIVGFFFIEKVMCNIFYEKSCMIKISIVSLRSDLYVGKLPANFHSPWIFLLPTLWFYCPINPMYAIDAMDVILLLKKLDSTNHRISYPIISKLPMCSKRSEIIKNGLRIGSIKENERISWKTNEKKQRNLKDELK